MERLGRSLCWALVFLVSLGWTAGCASVTDVLDSVNSLAAIMAILSDLLPM